MGYDTESESVVTIRELLPKGIANRLEGNPDVHILERYKKMCIRDRYSTDVINRHFA